MPEANQDKRSYMEQLREMRTSRMQQLRQSNQQAAIMNRQTAVMSNVYNILGKQLAVSNRLDSNQKITIRQTAATNTSLNNLSKSMAKSIGSLSMSIGRGAAGAVGSAGRGVSAVGGAAVGGVSALSSGILTGLAKVLPTAMVGYLGKTMLWDNMEDATKSKLQTAFSGLMEKMMIGVKGTDIGKQIDPFTEKLGDHLEVLGESFDKLSVKISKMVQSISKIVPPMPSTGEVRDRAGNILSGAKDVADTVSQKGRQTARFAERVSALVPSMDVKLPGAPDVSAGDVVKVTGAVAAVTGAAVVAGTKAPTTPATPVSATSPTTTSKKPVKKETAINKRARAWLAKEGNIKLTPRSIVSGRLAVKAASAGGAGAKFLAALKKYKLAGAVGVIGPAIEFFSYEWVAAGIDEALEEGVIGKEDADYLIKLARLEAGARMTGSTIFGTLGAVGGAVVGGPVGTVVGGATAGYFGGELTSEYASKAYQKFVPPPASLDTDISGKYQDAGEMTDTARKKKSKSGNVTPPPAAVSQPASGSTSKQSPAEIEAMILKKFMSAGFTKEQSIAFLANAQRESGFNPKASNVTDKEASYGLFQMNTKGGLGTGHKPEDLMDPEYNINLMIKAAMAAGISKTRTTEEAVADIVTKIERPANQKDEIATRIDIANQLSKKYAGADTQLAMNAQNVKPQASATATAKDSLPSKPYPEDAVPAADSMSFAERVAAKSKARQERKDIESSFDTTAEMKKPAEDKKIGLGTSLMGFLQTSKNDITAQIIAGLDQIQQFDIQKNVSTPMIINNKGGDTIVSSSSGGGGSSSNFAPVGVTAGYDSRFKSLAGVG